MKHAVLLASALLLPTAFTVTVHAASFDCAKAGTFVEHLICADQNLSTLDDGLSNFYRQALASSPRPDALRSAQRAWLREVRNACTSVQCLTQAYQARLDDLIPPMRSNSVTVQVPTPAAVSASPAPQAASAASVAAGATAPSAPRSTSSFSFKILDMRQHQRIADGSMFATKASEGATLVSVKYSYKNLTARPIGSMSLPGLVLLSPDGVRYQPDVGSSAAYAAVADLNTKVLSDLNPGLTATDADVFEVSTDLLRKPGWAIVIEADEDVKTPLVLKN